MNVAQLEHVSTFTEPPPKQSTLERMEELFIAWRREIVTAKNRRFQLEILDEAQASDRFIRISNQLTQSETRQKEILDEIVEVAGLIYAEHAALEVANAI